MENQPQNIEELEIIISESLVKTFHTFEELKEFIDSEKSYFEFLKKTIQFDHNLNSPISTMFRVYDDVISKTTQMLPQRKVAKTVETNLKAIKSSLQSSYKTGLLLYSNSHHAIFIKELFNKSPQISGYAYVSLSNQHTTCSWNSYFAFQGVLESELHLRGINEKTRSHTEKALEDIRGKTQLHLDEYTRKENELVRKISETLQKTEGMLRDKKKEFEDTLTLKSEEFSKFHQDSSDRFENINKTYREHIALKAPVEFWGDLRFYSYIRASIAFIIAALYTYFAGDFVIRQANKVGLLTKDDVSYGKIIFFVLLASAFIWILRIIFRYLVGQLHVANESTEKMVMTKTYMALLEDGKLEITERELVLKNVFRPSGSGLLGDDHPHPAMEIINNIQRSK